MQHLVPQQMPFMDFAKAATAVKLENHGRQWEVFLDRQSLGFADGPSANGAIRQVHEREVNNALYANDGDAPDFLKAELPTAAALNEYPGLIAKFPTAAQAVLAGGLPQP